MKNNTNFPTFKRIANKILVNVKKITFTQVIIVLFILGCLGCFLFDKYIEIKKHNLETAVQMRLCQNNEPREEMNCLGMVRKQFIGDN